MTLWCLRLSALSPNQIGHFNHPFDVQFLPRIAGSVIVRVSAGEEMEGRDLPVVKRHVIAASKRCRTR